jgi:eukaryotic-like serine/threonine-protein kinase
VEPSALLGSLLDAKYQLVEIVGRGGASTVLKGHDVRHGRLVAVKIIRSDTAHFGGPERFAREIAILAQLQHPHILPLLDSGLIDGQPYYVMPFVEGESLRDRLQREGRLAVQDVLRLVIEVCDALRYAHERGVVHRDIKPENVLLSGKHALLADFGVARDIGPRRDLRSTTAGLALGTPAYMAPEQAAADPAMDHRIDIYALGCVAFEMLTGGPPFVRNTPTALLAAHATETPADVSTIRPDVPPTVAQAITRCLEKHAADRWADAGELAEALEMSVVRSGGLTPHPLPVRSSNRRRVAIGVAAMVALAAAGYLALVRRQPIVAPAVTATKRLTSGEELELDPVASPDHRLVAYAAGRNGAMRIYVRQSNGDGEPIAVAEAIEANQRFPRWTPDGRFVLFQAGGSVVRVPALGGRVETVVEGDATRPAESIALSHDGRTLAFTQDGALRLLDVESRGASRELLRDGDAHSLAWSPDGSRIAFVSGNREFALSETLLGNVAPAVLRVVDASGGPPRTLTDGKALAASPAWLSNRAIAFVSDADGVRDVYVADASGGAESPHPRLTTGMNAHSVAASADGRQIAVGVLVLTSNVWSVPIPSSGVSDMTHARQVTTGVQIIEDVDALPVIGLLLFDSNKSGNQDVYMQNAGSSAPTRLTYSDDDEFGPAWAPGGREFAYYAVTNGVRHVHVMGVGGSKSVQVTADSLQDQQPRWSPDGQKLLFYRRDGGGRDRLFVVGRRADSTWGPATQLLDGFATAGAWSPDGSLIAYTDSAGRLLVVDSTGTQSRVVADARTVGAARFKRPNWLTTEPAMLARTDLPGGLGGIWRVPLDGERPVEVIRFDDPARPVYRDDFTTDGSRVYFTVSSMLASVWIIDLAGPRG